jgi:hypothetical protein
LFSCNEVWKVYITREKVFCQKKNHVQKRLKNKVCPFGFYVETMGGKGGEVEQASRYTPNFISLSMAS